MADGLAELGVKHSVREDGIVIEGGEIGGGEVNSHGDHRIAMAFTMAGLKAKAPIRIHDCHNVATSFPGFSDLAHNAGINLQSVEE
jgi:prephenate dehydrogenase/3-phosphoshikimate 1-carboxyvinyltransferase